MRWDCIIILEKLGLSFGHYRKDGKQYEKKLVLKENYCTKLIITIIITVIAFIGLSFGEVHALGIDKVFRTQHVMQIETRPLLTAIGVTVAEGYYGIYTDSGTTRTFSKHKHEVFFFSINDTALTSRLRFTISQLQFYTPTNKIGCTTTSCTCGIMIGKPIIKILHKCSVKKTTCKTGSTAYVIGGYTITGAVVPTVMAPKFTGIAK